MTAFAFDVAIADFERVVIEGSKTQPVVVDFWAEWCGPCKILKPLLEKLAEEMQGRFILAKVDSDKNQALAQQYGVRGIPAVKAFIDGEMVDEFSGALPEVQVREFLKRLIPSPAEQFLRAALEQREAGDFAGALALLGQASQLDPANENIRIEAADILLDQGQPDEAKALLDTISPLTRQEPRLHPLLAKLGFALSRKSGVSEVDLTARIAANVQDMDARLQLANLFIAAGRYIEGLDALLEMIRLDRSWNDAAARKAMLDVFTLSGAQNVVPIYRRKLASVLN